MIKKTKIAILCNNKMAFNAIGMLMESGSLVAVGVPDNNEDVVPYLEHITKNTALHLRKFSRNSFNADMLDFLSHTKADAVFIMTFPWLVPETVLSVLPGKVYNFHYGILPEMKGADPIFEAIRQRKQETGVTVHIASPKIDDGPILLSRKFPIDNEVTHGMLSSGMAQLAAMMSMELVQLIENGNIPEAAPQSGGKYYPRPVIEDIKINWEQMDSQDIHALARACNPWNKGAYCAYGPWNFKITGFSHTNMPVNSDMRPGSVIFINGDNNVFVSCKDKKCLKIETISTDEGFFPGHQLRMFGLKSGDLLH